MPVEPKLNSDSVPFNDIPDLACPFIVQQYLFPMLSLLGCISKEIPALTTKFLLPVILMFVVDSNGYANALYWY